MIYRKSISRLVLGSLLCLGFSIGQTRTLFFDFNNAESEIRIFRENLGGEPREVIVLPSYKRITHAQRRAAREASALIEMQSSRAQECASSRKPRVDRCDEVYAEIRRAELLRIEATGDYTAADLRAELRALVEHELQQNFDTLVVSGHHETGYYNGELTQANERDLARIFTESGIDRAQFNTIVLLACGTGTRNAYLEYLAPLFPDVPLIFGAEDSAPTRDEPRNLAFIRKLLLVRPNLLQAKTRQEVKPLYRSLLVEHWPVSLLWRRHTLFFAHGVEPFEAEPGQVLGRSNP
jgi:hypothetical protein